MAIFWMPSILSHLFFYCSPQPCVKILVDNEINTRNTCGYASKSKYQNKCNGSSGKMCRVTATLHFSRAMEALNESIQGS